MQKPFTIVCTTSILADAVRNVVGGHAQVISLMGPGIDPHLYRPREGDTHRFATAHIVFYHGLHLEGRLAHVLEALNRYVPTYAVSDAIPNSALRIVLGNNAYDPHVWHAVPLWIMVVSCIADCCARHDTAHASEYYYNADQYICSLLSLHRWITESISTIPRDSRILVTAHDAFAYFGETYGLEVMALQGINTEAEISSCDVYMLIEYIMHNNISTLFLETAIPHRTLQIVIDAVRAQGRAIEIGTVLYADALGDERSGADTYITMMQHNVRSLVAGLRQK